MTSRMPPSVNYHHWQACNMRYRYCFAQFKDVRDTILPKGHLPMLAWLTLCRHFDKPMDGSYTKKRCSLEPGHSPCKRVLENCTACQRHAKRRCCQVSLTRFTPAFSAH